MIILSGVLVVLAILLLVAGIVFGASGTEVMGMDEMTLIYISIAVSIVSTLCLAIGVFLRRKELFGTPAASRQGKAQKNGGKARQAAGKGVAASRPGAAEADAEDTLTIPAQPVEVPDDALVYVVRGRKRYHLDSCRQLMGREKEELTYAEAREEGFSPCTACLPDTALTARAAAGATAGADASDRSGESDRSGRSTDERAAARERAAEPGRADEDRPEDRTRTEPASIWLPPDRSARTAGALGRRPGDEPAGSRAETAGESHAEEASGAAGDTDDVTAAEPQDSPDTAPTTAFDAVDPATEPEDESGAETLRETRESGPETGSRARVPKPRESSWTVELDQDRDEDASGATGGPDADAHAGDDDRPDPERDEPAQGGTEPASEETAPPSGSSADGPQVRILSGTKRYHRADCALIVDIGDDADDLEALSRSEAAARGCTPCLVCEPDKEPARD